MRHPTDRSNYPDSLPGALLLNDSWFAQRLHWTTEFGNNSEERWERSLTKMVDCSLNPRTAKPVLAYLDAKP